MSKDSLQTASPAYGLLGKAEEEINRPAYVVEARHGALTAITVGSLVRAIAERGAVWGTLKRQRQREIHPPEKILECAKRASWDQLVGL